MVHPRIGSEYDNLEMHDSHIKSTRICISVALQMAANDDSVSIVALTGEGEYYSSGNDISKFLAVTDPQNEVKEAYKALKSLIYGICSFPKLLICVVNGPCIGIAATTAVLCDIIYATENVNSFKHS